MATDDDRDYVRAAFDDAWAEPAIRWGDVYHERSEHVVSDLLPEYRASIVDVLGDWIRSPSTTDGRTLLALHLAAHFQFVELLDDIRVLDARIVSGEALLPVHRYSTQRALRLLTRSEP